MCKLCEQKPVYEFTNKRKVCKTCFLRWFEKKFLYTIRKFDMFKIGDKVGHNKKDVVLEYLLEMYAGKGRIELVHKGGNKIALADTNDVVAFEVVEEVINGKFDLKNKQPVEGKTIKPLILFLDKEVELYVKLRGLKSKKVKTQSSKLGKFVDGLKVKHPELPHAVVQSVLKLK